MNSLADIAALLIGLFAAMVVLLYILTAIDPQTQAVTVSSDVPG